MQSLLLCSLSWDQETIFSFIQILFYPIDLMALSCKVTSFCVTLDQNENDAWILIVKISINKIKAYGHRAIKNGATITCFSKHFHSNIFSQVKFTYIMWIWYGNYSQVNRASTCKVTTHDAYVKYNRERGGGWDCHQSTFFNME